MKDLSQLTEKLKLTYPCNWTYKLIGSNQDLIKAAVKEVMADKTYHLAYSNQSKGGKYISMSLVVEVTSDEERQAYYEKFKKSDAIKMVV